MQIFVIYHTNLHNYISTKITRFYCEKTLQMLNFLVIMQAISAKVKLKFKEKIMGKYIELKEDNFDQEISSGVSLVDFWAPWCGPCKMLAPVIDKLAEEYEGKAKICKVNTDEEGNLAAKFGVRSIPTMFFIKDGEVIDQIIGAVSESALKEKLNNVLNG